MRRADQNPALPRAQASDDRRDLVVGAFKRMEDTFFVPAFSLLLASPLWGPLLAVLLEWPTWLGILVSLTPCLSLFVAGQLHIALRKWTNLKRARASSFEPPLIAALLLVGVALPLALHYGAL